MILERKALTGRQYNRECVAHGGAESEPYQFSPLRFRECGPVAGSAKEGSSGALADCASVPLTN